MNLSKLTAMEINPLKHPLNSLFSPSINLERIVGALAQTLVINMLEKQPGLVFDSNFPLTIGEYTFVSLPSGIEVLSREKHVLHEFDGLFYEETTGSNYIIEVKSNHLNGYRKKIERAFYYARMLYSNDVKMVIIIPFPSRKPRSFKKIEYQNPNVHFVDLKMEPQQLITAAKKIITDKTYHTNYR